MSDDDRKTPPPPSDEVATKPTGSCSTHSERPDRGTTIVWEDRKRKKD